MFKLKIMNWKLFKQIISDKDKKFSANFETLCSQNSKFDYCITLFIIFKQINFLNKLINQSKLFFDIIWLFWSNALSFIQKKFNDFTTATKRFSNKCVYKFISMTSANLCFISNVKNSVSIKWTRQKVTDVIVFFFN